MATAPAAAPDIWRWGDGVVVGEPPNKSTFWASLRLGSITQSIPPFLSEPHLTLEEKGLALINETVAGSEQASLSLSLLQTDDW